jgi:hypothetical protein
MQKLDNLFFGSPKNQLLAKASDLHLGINCYNSHKPKGTTPRGNENAGIFAVLDPEIKAMAATV